MDVARPYSGIAPTVDGDVLVALAGTTKPLTGRQVARLVRRGSQPAVNAALDRLAAHGLVHREDAPPAILHTLNRSHVGAPAVEALAGMRSEFLRRLRSALTGWEIPAAHASVFGSAARGDGGTESDVDVFVVRPRGIGEGSANWRTQVATLVADITAWTGNRASVVEVAEHGAQSLARSSPVVLSELRKDSIHLAGQALDDLVEDAG